MSGSALSLTWMIASNPDVTGFIPDSIQKNRETFTLPSSDHEYMMVEDDGVLRRLLEE